MRFADFWENELQRPLTDIEKEQAHEVEDCLGRGAGLMVNKEVSEVVDRYYDYLRDRLVNKG